MIGTAGSKLEEAGILDRMDRIYGIKAGVPVP
jgi:hypothetical protein